MKLLKVCLKFVYLGMVLKCNICNYSLQCVIVLVSGSCGVRLRPKFGWLRELKVMMPD